MFAAMLISSWVFGMVHGDLIWFMYAFLLGIVLTYIGEKCGALTASIIVHMAFNLFGSLTGLLGDMSETTFFILLISSGLVSLAPAHSHRQKLRAEDRVFQMTNTAMTYF